MTEQRKGERRGAYDPAAPRPVMRDASNRRSPMPLTADRLTDDLIRNLWRKAGGSFHGPNVETGTMPEARLLVFMRGLLISGNFVDPSTDAAEAVRKRIHWPACWDTAAYPTLESALMEICGDFKCSECAASIDKGHCAEIKGLACECLTWARTDGRLTDHHPGCEKFSELRYIKVSNDGAYYVMPLSTFADIVHEFQDNDGIKLTLEIVKMTKEEYDRLPEFNGF